MKKWFLVDKKKLVDQKMRNWLDNWSTKETDQKYMDAAKHMLFLSKFLNNKARSLNDEPTNQPASSIPDLALVHHCRKVRFDRI
jgi:hypothetical protein